MEPVKVLIVEDEEIAAKRLVQLLKSVDKRFQVLETLPSIRKTVKWFEENQAHLAFFDIQLADGLSFEIFKQTNVHCPVIFTTAYDQYAIKAFKVNSIDYLLKPIDEGELKIAVEKFLKLHKSSSISSDILTAVEIVFEKINKKGYKSRFVVKVGEHIKIINTEEIAYFKSQDKATFLHLADGKRYLVDEPLDQIEKIVDPSLFFRINRKYLSNLKFIQDIVAYSNSRLKIIIAGIQENDSIVSREKVTSFRKWLEK